MNSLAVRVGIVLVALGVLVAAGTFAFSAVEDLALFEAFYFTVVTVSTVGYGDIEPATTAGRVLAIVLIVIGVGVFLGVVANATQFLLHRRQERLRKQRVNMAVSTFYSEVGSRLLRLFCSSDPALETLEELRGVDNRWTGRDFERLRKRLEVHHFNIDPDRMDLEALRDFLQERRGLLLSLLENPNLVEHEAFTDLLRAVFHLKDELAERPDLSDLPPSDLEHLANDTRRAYAAIASQWLDNLAYLQKNYPFLFSLETRLNPFKTEISAIVS